MQDITTDTSTQPILSRSRPRWGRILAWGGLLSLLAILALGLLRAQQGPVGEGQRAPAFKLTTFEGQEIELGKQSGKVVVINFWASWCKPCEQEAAELEAAWRYYQPQGDVLFLGVDYVDTEPEAKAYLQKFDVTYPNGADLGGRISQSFRILGVPETYIVNQEGLLVDKKIGPFESLDNIKAMIDPHLKP